LGHGTQREDVFESSAYYDPKGRNYGDNYGNRRAAREYPPGGARRTFDETKLSFKTTEFWALAGIIAAILVASAVSDSLGDVRAWTLVTAGAIGYMISRGLAKSGTKHAGSAESHNQNNR
jgi:hypothetical protein